MRVMNPWSVKATQICEVDKLVRKKSDDTSGRRIEIPRLTSNDEVSDLRNSNTGCG